MAKVTKRSKRGKRGLGRLYKRAGGKEFPPESKVTGSYWLAYTLHGVRRREGLYDEQGRPITRRSDAEAARTKILGAHVGQKKADSLKTLLHELGEAEADTAIAIDAATPILTLSSTWAAFKTNPGRPDAGAQTLRQYEYQWGQFADWLKKKHPECKGIRDVTPELANFYARHLTSTGKSANTYNKHLNLLALVWSVLSVEAHLECNPWANPKKNPGARGIQRKKLQGESRRELTLEELKRICEPLEGEMRVLFALGIYTGLRLKDAATLEWGEVDLGQSVIRRVPSKTARNNADPLRIPIHSELRGMLEGTPTRRRKGPVLPDTAAAYAKGSATVSGWVQRHFERCGIRTRKPDTGRSAATGKGGGVSRGSGKRAVVEVGFHSLRHTFVSLCRGANAPLSVVEAIVGHSNPAMTRHYTHVGGAAAESAIAALPSISGVDVSGPPAVDPLAGLGNRSARRPQRPQPEGYQSRAASRGGAMKLQIVREDLTPASKKKLRSLLGHCTVVDGEGEVVGKLDLDAIAMEIEAAYRMFQNWAPAKPLPKDGLKKIRAILDQALYALRAIKGSPDTLVRVTEGYYRVCLSLSAKEVHHSGSDKVASTYDDVDTVINAQTEKTCIYRPKKSKKLVDGVHERFLEEVKLLELIERLERAVERAQEDLQGTPGRPKIHFMDRMFIHDMARIYVRHIRLKPTGTPDPGRGKPRKILFSQFLAVATNNLVPGFEYTERDIRSALRRFYR